MTQHPTPGTPTNADTRRLGDLLFIGFDGTELTGPIRSFLLEIRPGGIILFRRNIVEPRQVLKLTADLHALYAPAPLIAVDEEGGNVSRLQLIAPTLPPMATLASAGPETMRAMSGKLGRIVAAAGMDIDFAPVVDLCRPDSPNGIGDRSFGLDPGTAATMAGAYLDGLSDAGVLGCLKHFPGLGPTLFDSHHHLPTVQKQKAPFLAEDLLPYRRLHARAPLIMIGHGHYPFLSGDDPIAATLMPGVVTDLLRGDIGYAGVAVADDIEMKAVSARMSYKDLAPRMVTAGCDMVLSCRNPEVITTSLAAIRSSLQDGSLPAGRVAEALGRIDTLRASAAALARRRAAPPSFESFQTACADLKSSLAALA